MRNNNLRMEFITLPSQEGQIKIHIYGFNEYGSWGQVFSELNGVTVTAQGYSRKKTVIRSIVRLNEILLKQNE